MIPTTLLITDNKPPPFHVLLGSLTSLQGLLDVLCFASKSRGGGDEALAVLVVGFIRYYGGDNSVEYTSLTGPHLGRVGRGDGDARVSASD